MIFLFSLTALDAAGWGRSKNASKIGKGSLDTDAAEALPSVVRPLTEEDAIGLGFLWNSNLPKAQLLRPYCSEAGVICSIYSAGSSMEPIS